MPSHHFDAADAARFLNPKIFYAGASFAGSDCQLSRFFNEGIWENGFIDYLKQNPTERTSVTDNYETYMADIHKGDTLIVKRLNGKGSSTMRLLAIGIVLGKNYNKTLRIAWVMQDLSFETNLVCVGTISKGYALSEIEEKTLALIQKARAKFLRLNLAISNRYY